MGQNGIKEQYMTKIHQLVQNLLGQNSLKDLMTQAFLYKVREVG
jgi:uncharacterized protein YigA (DUF484 family)